MRRTLVTAGIIGEIIKMELVLVCLITTTVPEESLAINSDFPARSGKRREEKDELLRWFSYWIDCRASNWIVFLEITREAMTVGIIHRARCPVCSNSLEIRNEKADQMQARIAELEAGFRDQIGQLQFCKDRNDELCRDQFLRDELLRKCYPFIQLNPGLVNNPLWKEILPPNQQ